MSLLAWAGLLLGSCDGPTRPRPPEFTLAVQLSGHGTGRVTSQPTGIDCGASGASCSLRAAQGTQVTLSAAPDPNSEFGGWSQACGGTSGCVVTLNGNVTVGAKFDNPRLAVQEIGAAGGTLRSLDGRLTLQVPAGALSTPIALSVEAITASELGPEFAGLDIDLVYRLGPPGTTFQQPARVTVVSSRHAVEDGDEITFPLGRLFTSRNGALEPLDSVVQETDADSLRLDGEMRHFSVVAAVFDEVKASIRIVGLPVPPVLYSDEVFIAEANVYVRGTASVEDVRYVDFSLPPVEIRSPAIQVLTEAPPEPGEQRYSGSLRYGCTEVGQGRLVAQGVIRSNGVTYFSRLARRRIDCIARPVLHAIVTTPRSVTANVPVGASCPAPVAHVAVENTGNVRLEVEVTSAEGTMAVPASFSFDPKEIQQVEILTGCPGGTKVDGVMEIIARAGGSDPVRMDVPIHIFPVFPVRVALIGRGGVSVNGEQCSNASDPPGAEPRICVFHAVHGNNIELAAAAADGWRFDAWQGSLTGTNPILPLGPVVSPIDLELVFKQLPPALSDPSFVRETVEGPATQLGGTPRAIAAMDNAIVAVGLKDGFDRDWGVSITGQEATAFLLPWNRDADARVNGVYFDALRRELLVVGDGGAARCPTLGSCVIETLSGFDPQNYDLHAVAGNQAVRVVAGRRGLDQAVAWFDQGLGWGPPATVPFQPGDRLLSLLVPQDTQLALFGNGRQPGGFQAAVATWVNGLFRDLTLTGFTNIHSLASWRPSAALPRFDMGAGHPNGLPSNLLELTPGGVNSILSVNDAFLEQVCTVESDSTSPRLALGRLAGMGPGRTSIHALRPGGGTLNTIVDRVASTNCLMSRTDTGHEAVYFNLASSESPAAILGTRARVTADGISAAPFTVAAPVVRGPLTADLDAVAAGANHLVAVGEKGMALHHDGGTWQATIVATDSDGGGLRLRAVAAAGSSTSFVVGDRGAILRFDAGAWTRMANPAEALQRDLFAVSGAAPNDVYAVGQGIILHGNGLSWSQVAVPGLNLGTLLFSVWHGGNNVFVGGAAAGGALILRYDGSSWTNMSLPHLQGGDAVTGIWGSSPTDVWAITQAGAILHFDGTAWSSDDYQTARSLLGLPIVVMAGLAGSAANDVYVVTDGGMPGVRPSAIMRYDGKRWTVVHTVLDSRLRGVAVQPNGGVHAVGSDGTLLRGTR